MTVWVIATGTLQADPVWGIKGPVHRQKMVTPLSDDELRALIAPASSPCLPTTSTSQPAG